MNVGNDEHPVSALGARQLLFWIYFKHSRSVTGLLISAALCYILVVLCIYFGAILYWIA